MKTFNTIIVGVGGQGLITLNNVIATAAFIEGYDVRTSELHGLSQRRGAVQTYIRFGEKVYSPLFDFGKADLVLALEITEGLRAVSYKNEKTIFVVNKNFLSYDTDISENYIVKELNLKIGKNLHLIPASEICQKELSKEVVSSIYLLGYCVFKKIVPLKEESILKAIEKIIPEKHSEINKRAFELAKNI